MTHLMLVGNPNCGKTTLFNALTGDNQRVGNWSGVTVEKKTGQFKIKQQCFDVTDLPGVYSLAISALDSSQDAKIAAKAVMQQDADCIINVVDACHLERHLYLTSQLLELNIPLILVVNMMDIAQQRGITLDTQALSLKLRCPVVVLQAHKQIGMDALKDVLVTQNAGKNDASFSMLQLPAAVQTSLASLEHHLVSVGHKPSLVPYLARRMLEGDATLANIPAGLIEPSLALEIDVLMADARYQAIHQLVTGVQKKKSDTSEHFTAKLDRIVLHRFWSFPIFFGMMYLVFFLAIQAGGSLQGVFDSATDTIFVKGSAWFLQQLNAPDWLIALCADGIGKGINTTLTFIPVMASMYFLLSLLESSGYMVRAAFVVDKAMRMLGLPGKAFVPMIVGFGCNVPAIMASRTLDSERDRLLTVMMSPFMSCSARLAIYATFVAAFFPTGGQNIVFSLYLIGILMAVLTGFLLRKTLLRGQASPLILELPAYHRPSLRRLMKETSLRLRYFILRAGKIIIPVCLLLGGLNSWMVPVSGHETQSILSLFGQWLTPLFSPMGIHQDNWPATVGLLMGALAKEVVVGSLNGLYAQMGHLSDTATIYGVMFQKFDGKIGAYAYLLFILLYVPCVSTMAAIRQETSRKWMWFSIGWSFVVAYATAVSFYQIATIEVHPQQTIAWLTSLTACIVCTLIAIKWSAPTAGGQDAITNS